MYDFHIEGSDYTPGVDFNSETKELNILEASRGREYTPEFLEPILNWLKQFMVESGESITFNYRMRYFDKNSSHLFLAVVDTLEGYQFDKDGSVTINWIDDETGKIIDPLGELKI